VSERCWCGLELVEVTPGEDYRTCPVHSFPTCPEDLYKLRQEVVRKVVPDEHYDEYYAWWIGYVENEGEAWRLVCVGGYDEAEKFMQEYQETGKLTLGIRFGQISQVVEPVAVAKFHMREIFRSVQDVAVKELETE